MDCRGRLAGHVSSPTAAAKGIACARAAGADPRLGRLAVRCGDRGIAVWNLKPSPPSPQPVSRTVRSRCRRANNWQVWIAALLWPSLPTAPISRMSPRQGGTQQLYLRAMDSLEAKPIPGTEGAVSPFFSPDGQWLGFFAGGKLKKVSVSGGAAVTLGDAAVPRGASWGSQGTIAFAPTTGSSSPANAGRGRHPAAADSSRERGDQPPLAGVLARRQGSALCCSRMAANWTNAQVAVQSLGTGERRNLIQGGTQPRYAPSGHLVYAQGGT